MTLGRLLSACLVAGFVCGMAPAAGPPAAGPPYQTNRCCDGMCHQCPPHPLHPDRPTPAPCCADGRCYPKPETWGYYATQWRRWPIPYVQPSAAGAVPPALGPDFQPYELPPPEEEDRRAPPPTVPPRPDVPPVRRAEPPAEAGEEAAPAAPPGPGQQAPDLPFGEPFGEPPAGAAPFGMPQESPAGAAPFEVPEDEMPQTAPLTPPAETPPATSPFGASRDDDPPPALPLAPSLAARQPAPATVALAASQRRVTRLPQTDDPPPAPPIAALGQLSK